MTGRRWRAVLLVLLGTGLAASGPVAAQALFESNDVLHIRIDGPFATLQRTRFDNEKLPATLTVVGEDGAGPAVAVTLRARGNFRRKWETCSFPPIRLDFARKDTAGTVFDGQRRLKLVTHCRTSSKTFEQYILREYLAYRILGVLTDRSLRVRLLRIGYRDTERDDEPFERWGFLIEDRDDFGVRTGLQRLKVPTLAGSTFDPAHTSLVNLFEYMIGNTDYSLVAGMSGENCCHNVVPYSDGDSIWPVPYDFDFSGLINAPYAEPDPRFRIRTVTTRVYRGSCRFNANIPGSVAQFRAGRDSIYALVNEIEALDARSRKSVLKYLDRFYSIIDDDKKMQRQIVKQCS